MVCRIAPAFFHEVLYLRTVISLVHEEGSRQKRKIRGVTDKTGTQDVGNFKARHAGEIHGEFYQPVGATRRTETVNQGATVLS